MPVEYTEEQVEKMDWQQLKDAAKSFGIGTHGITKEDMRKEIISKLKSSQVVEIEEHKDIEATEVSIVENGNGDGEVTEIIEDNPAKEAYVPKDDIEKVVIDGYIAKLGRRPDAEGFRTYTKKLKTNMITVARFLQILEQSDEAVNKKKDKDDKRHGRKRHIRHKG